MNLKRGVIPLYHQVKDLLIENIESGLWPPGFQLAPENELAAQYGVSRVTVRQAMQFLANQGLIERQQGRGTFVSRPKVSQNLLTIGSMITSAETSEIPATLVSIKKVKAPPSIGNRLELQPSDKVYEVLRIVIEGDEALMLVTSWLPTHLFPALETVAPERFLRMRRLFRDFYGIEIVRQRKEIEVTVLDDYEAAVLHAERGAAALLMTYLNRDSRNQPLEFRRWLVRGDRCKYVVDLAESEASLPE